MLTYCCCFDADLRFNASRGVIVGLRSGYSEDSKVFVWRLPATTAGSSVTERVLVPVLVHDMGCSASSLRTGKSNSRFYPCVVNVCLFSCDIACRGRLLCCAMYDGYWLSMYVDVVVRCSLFGVRSLCVFRVSCFAYAFMCSCCACVEAIDRRASR